MYITQAHVLSSLVNCKAAAAAETFFGSPVSHGHGDGAGHQRSAARNVAPAALDGASPLPCSPPRASGALLVLASTMCPPRTNSSVRPSTRAGSLELTATRLRRRQRRRRAGGGGWDGGSSGSDSGDDGYSWWSGEFDGISGGGGGVGGSGRWSGGGRWSSGGGWGGSSFGDWRWHSDRTIYECMWVWQLLCAASLVQTLHFLLFPKQQVGMDGENAAAGMVAVAAC